MSAPPLLSFLFPSETDLIKKVEEEKRASEMKKRKKVLRDALGCKKLGEPLVTLPKVVEYLLSTEIAQNFVKRYGPINANRALKCTMVLKGYVTEMKVREEELIEEFMSQMSPTLFEQKLSYIEVNFRARSKLNMHIEPYPKGNFVISGTMGARLTKFLKTQDGSPGIVERLRLISVGDIITKVNNVAGDYETLYNRLRNILKKSCEDDFVSLSFEIAKTKTMRVPDYAKRRSEMLLFAKFSPLLVEYTRAMHDTTKTSWLLNKVSVAKELCATYRRKKNVEKELHKNHYGFILTSAYTTDIRDLIEQFIDTGVVDLGRGKVVIREAAQLTRAIKKILKAMKEKLDKGNFTSTKDCIFAVPKKKPKKHKKIFINKYGQKVKKIKGDGIPFWAPTTSVFMPPVCIPPPLSGGGVLQQQALSSHPPENFVVPPMTMSMMPPTISDLTLVPGAAGPFHGFV
jgi:hypothetical protein